VRDLLHSVELLDLVEGVYARRESSMETKDLVFHNRGHWKSVKQVSEKLPHVGVSVFSKALIIESVDLSDLPRLMVSSKDSDSFLVSHFEGNEKSDCFN